MKTPAEQLARANRIIGWMMPYISNMCPPPDGLAELNEHCLENHIPDPSRPAPGRPANTTAGRPLNQRPASGSISERARAKGPARPQPGRGSAETVDRLELREVLEQIEISNGGSFEGIGPDFLNQLMEKTHQFAQVRMSPRQDEWLRRIAKGKSVDIPWPEIT